MLASRIMQSQHSLRWFTVRGARSQLLVMPGSGVFVWDKIHCPEGNWSRMERVHLPVQCAGAVSQLAPGKLEGFWCRLSI